MIVYIILSIFIGIIIGYIIRIGYGKKKVKSAEHIAERIIKEAMAKSENIIKESKRIAENEKNKLEREYAEKKHELFAFERKLLHTQENIEKKMSILEKREKEIEERLRIIKQKERMLEEERENLSKIRQQQQEILTKISNLSLEDAKKILLQNIEEEMKKEMAEIIYKNEQLIRQTEERRAKEILATAIQRVSPEIIEELTITNVSLPNDEIKGRIIGREGRNIRTFEQLTGVDIIIDDTPETITISSTDPVRREIAKQALEILITDARIHPARIEEVVEKVKKNFSEHLKKIGEDAAMQVGITNLPDEILQLIGKLKFRTSYGQNQLQHTLEVVYLASTIAAELGADIEVTKRAALLHDIGKALDHTSEGAHHELSAKLARKYSESETVVSAILSHHEGFDTPRSVEAFIVATADAISASRPGARKESIEGYLKRIQSLENIAMSFKGVANAYAVHAGREVRVMVQPEIITDHELPILAREIAKKIEKETSYPGQIKVYVIRETRAQEFAK